MFESGQTEESRDRVGLTALVTWQTLSAQPLLRPDALTVGVFGLLMGTSLALVGLIVAHARRRARAPESLLAAGDHAM